MKDYESEKTSLLSNVKYVLLNPMVLLGLLSFGISFIAYSIVLSKVKLNIAYPLLTSGGFILVILFSIFLFKENITLFQGVGITLILIGVWMVSATLK